MESLQQLSLARALYEGRLSGSPISQSEHSFIDVHHALNVLDQTVKLAESSGARRAGYKIGLTAPAAREAYKTDSPVYGHLFDYTIAEPDGVIDVRRMFNPAAEAEVAFIIGTAIMNPLATADDARAAVKAAAPAIEIIDSRWDGGAQSLSALLADNANAAAAVIGQGVPLPKDLATATSLLALDDIEHYGTTEPVFGNPLESLAWLIRELSSQGKSLNPGDVVLTGSMNPPAALTGQACATAVISGLGSVSVSFSRG